MSKKVLIVCSGNTCRSPMAEAIMRKLVLSEPGLDIKVFSAGLYACNGEPASENAKKAVSLYGADLTDHSSRLLSDELLADADLILAMTTAHKNAILAAFPGYSEKLFTFTEFAGDRGDIIDPFGQNLKVYEDTAGQVFSAAKKIIARLKSPQ